MQSRGRMRECFTTRWPFSFASPMLALLLAMYGPSPSNAEEPGIVSVTLQPVLSKSFEEPVYVTAAPGDPKHLYVVEKEGRVRIIEGDKTTRYDLIDIEDLVSTKGEQGLLSIAFPPDYQQTKKAYINYTDVQGDTVIARFKALENDVVEDDQIEVVLKIVQPYPNHNGGQLQFGPDGYLYIGMGDGGGAGDPNGNAQNLRAMLGKMLRIDVSGSGEYSIPKDNPFVATKGALPEIWALGFRNPWRFSFDREGGRLFVSDVGQNTFEEVDIVERGKNYGWNIFEGTSCFKPPCKEDGYEKPITEYGRREGVSIIGGYVYRGTAIPELRGAYIFGDYGSGRIWALTQHADGWRKRELLKISENITSFGQDNSGEVYVTVQQGRVYRLVAKGGS